MPIPQSARTLHNLILRMQERECQDHPSGSGVLSRTPPTDMVARALWRRELRHQQHALRQQQDARRRRNHHLRQRRQQAERLRIYNNACSLRQDLQHSLNKIDEVGQYLYDRHLELITRYTHCQDDFGDAARRFPDSFRIVGVEESRTA